MRVQAFSSSANLLSHIGRIHCNVDPVHADPLKQIPAALRARHASKHLVLQIWVLLHQLHNTILRFMIPGSYAVCIPELDELIEEEAPKRMLLESEGYLVRKVFCLLPSIHNILEVDESHGPPAPLILVRFVPAVSLAAVMVESKVRVIHVSETIVLEVSALEEVAQEPSLRAQLEVPDCYRTYKFRLVDIPLLLVVFQLLAPVQVLGVLRLLVLLICQYSCAARKPSGVEVEERGIDVGQANDLVGRGALFWLQGVSEELGTRFKGVFVEMEGAGFCILTDNTYHSILGRRI